jgi:DNA polymerase
MQKQTTDPARALVRWYVEMGVDDAVGDTPRNWLAQAAPDRSPSPQAHAPLATSIAATPLVSADEAASLAGALAQRAATLEELAEAIARFDGCPLKAGARSTVVYDGIAGAPLLVIGEAPGKDEDAAGKPFVGRAGQLLDRMLAAIARSRRENVLITNVVFWRPPGNRTPTQAEVAICKPFLDRLIALTKPKAVILAGATPLQALTGMTGVMRARGQWRETAIDRHGVIDVLPTLHPAFLLRQPTHKRLVWRDFLAVEQRLRDD